MYPRYAVVNSVSEALAEVQRIGLPAVAKPTDRTSSAGVAKLESWATVEGLVRDALLWSRDGRALIEQYLEGTEHTVSGIAANGEVHITGFSDRDYSAKCDFGPYFFERGDMVPTSLSPQSTQRVCNAVTAGVRALQLEPGEFNTEY